MCAHDGTLARPARHRPGRREVSVPGSKSVTNRALVLAALAAEPAWLRGPLRSRDTLLMADALRALGVGIEERRADGGADWRVHARRPLHGPATVDVGNAGTVHALPAAASPRSPTARPLRRRPAGPRAPAGTA